MKEIKAYIKELKQDSVTRALHQIEGLKGASFSRVLGFGRGKEKSTGYNPDADPSGYVRHVKVEVVCADELAEAVVTAIHRAAHTGLRGDGRIFIGTIVRSECRMSRPEHRIVHGWTTPGPMPASPSGFRSFCELAGCGWGRKGHRQPRTRGATSCHCDDNL